jgi:hypothetical protein
MFPAKLLNRLHLGRSLAAEIAPFGPELAAWLLVVPVLAEGASMVKPGPLSEPRVGGDHPQPVRGYRIIRIEVPRDGLESLDEGDISRDEVKMDENFAGGEEELAVALRSWLDDPSLLRHPDSISHLNSAIFWYGLVP